MSLVEHQHTPKASQDINTVNGNSDEGPWAMRMDVGEPNMHAIYQEAEERMQNFRVTIEKYITEAGSYGSVQFDTKALHSWDDVLKMQRHIIEHHEAESSKGLKGFCRKKVRSIGKNSECFQAWLKLLPTASPYVSILCGGFILLLEAAYRSSEIAEEVQSVLDDIPSTLSTAEQFLTTYEESAALHKCSAALYVAILDTLDATIREYHKHTGRRISSRIFKQNGSGQHISEKVKQIHIQANRLAILANIESLQRQKLIHIRGEDIGKLLVSLAGDQTNGFKRVEDSQQQIINTLQFHGTMITAISDFLVQPPTFLAAGPLISEGPKQIFGNLRVKSQENRAPENGQAWFETPAAIEEVEEARRKLTALVVVLNIDQDSDVAISDTAANLNLVYTLSVASQGRAVALITSPRIQDWLTSTCSSILLVNGRMFSNENETRQSPLSFFCAKIVDSITASQLAPMSRARNRLLVVRWFCGQHTDVRRDYDAHPPGMLNNILSQLACQLLQHGILETLEYPWCPLESEPRLPELCCLFVRLFKALPSGTTLFCVIDDINFYEDADRRDECMETLSMLTDLGAQGQDTKDGPSFKLLVTAPLCSHYVQSLFEKNNIMNMDEHYAPTGGFSALQWDLGAGSVLGE